MNPPNTPNHHIPRDLDQNVRRLTGQVASPSTLGLPAASSSLPLQHSVPFGETGAMQDKNPTEDMRTISTYNNLSSETAKISVAKEEGDVIMKDTNHAPNTLNNVPIHNTTTSRMSFPSNPNSGGNSTNGVHIPPQAVPMHGSTNGPNPGHSAEDAQTGVYQNITSALGFGVGGRRLMDINVKKEQLNAPSTATIPVSIAPPSFQNPREQQLPMESQIQLDDANASSTGTGTNVGVSSSLPSIETARTTVPNHNAKKSLTAAETALLAVQQFRNKANVTLSGNATAPAMGVGTGPNTESNLNIVKPQAMIKDHDDAAPMEVDLPTSSEESNPNPFTHVKGTAGENVGVGPTNDSNVNVSKETVSNDMPTQSSIPPSVIPGQPSQPLEAEVGLGGAMQQQQQSSLKNTNPTEQLQKGMLPPRPPPPMDSPHMPPTVLGHMRELKVEDALNYLDQVKIEFGTRPRIYNEFLEIMKNFKAHELDTPGVIMRVSDLFRGYNKLILGFNTFLPDGFKISIKDLEEGGRYASKKGPNMGPNMGSSGNTSSSHATQQSHPSGGPGFMMKSPPQPLPPTGVHGVRRSGQTLQALQTNRPAAFTGSLTKAEMLQPFKQNQNQNQGIHPPAQAGEISGNDMHHLRTQQGPPPNDNGQNGHQAVEFDHAITYVTTIKKRFATEPRTYQQFLEILHTYQKEQRGIREVLEQVSSLFADHPDLLREFTYFLPEAVQEQAKERLQAAAAEAEARQAAARQRAMETSNQYPSHQFHSTTSPSTGNRGGNQEIIDMTKKQQPMADGRSPTSPGQRKRPHSPSNITLQYPIMPETMIYSAGVERQFFDMAKEALRSSSRDGELAWAEFLKCMHYYAQEILSKNDLLRYMEDLLGKQHADLFEEFKRILAAAGAPGAPAHDDTWHSVPLSEIDFSRCRRCTPSYRALPRDYPVAPFSGRCEEEAKLLNDVWISLPDGSEESYTFRHMRKNQHEEVLFRCEDERFEIDMVIDSNATALKRLEPIAEEIAMLQQTEAAADGRDRSGLKSSQDKGGLAGKTIKFSFDKRILNTIHRHAISRIYGDAGQEMLELIHKNPVVAIPVVVKRLKQKDRDFRAAREVLNLRWKELAEINYYKSIDHRSLTWRTIDKRATSTRTLVAEIKDRAANSGTESEPAVLAKKEKAKEEFGSFYERTMGHYLAKKMDLTNLPRPAETLFTPHYSMKYHNNSWAQRDAYRILSFALERGSISPGDKERCHRIWKDFLAPFFDLSSIWMQSPAVAYAVSPHHNSPSIVSNGEDSGNEEDESSTEENDIIGDMMVTEEVLKDCSNVDAEAGSSFSLLDNQPIPSGTVVSTLYGEGTVVKYMHTERTCVVSLPFGATAYLNRDSVLCTILPVDQFDLQHSIPSSEDALERDDDKIILGPQSLYLFFRLHQVLIKRLNTARKLAFSVDNDQSLCTLIEHMESDGCAPVGQKRYDAYLSLVYSLVEGGYNSPFQGSSANAAAGGKYEDRVRCLLGHEAYELATMDKLVSHILKHLQNLANDDTMQGMIQIFKKQLDSGSFKPMMFRQEAAMISEGENVFAFQYCKIPKSDSTIMHAQLLGCITEEDDEDDDSDKASLTGMEVSESNEGPASKKLRRD